VADTGRRAGPVPAGSQTYEVAGPSGWTAWVIFAGVLMMMMGSFHAIAGLVALFEDEYYVVRPSGLVLTMDYTAWGWTHLLLGILVAGAGAGAVVGQTWARTVGVILAVVSAVANMLFIAAYPVWSIVIITLDVIIIYALIVHGRELKEP
jgi:hypothetical protein